MLWYVWEGLKGGYISVAGLLYGLNGALKQHTHTHTTFHNITKHTHLSTHTSQVPKSHGSVCLGICKRKMCSPSFSIWLKFSRAAFTNLTVKHLFLKFFWFAVIQPGTTDTDFTVLERHSSKMTMKPSKMKYLLSLVVLSYLETIERPII